MDSSLRQFIYGIIDPPVCSFRICTNSRFKSLPLCLKCCRKMLRITESGCLYCGLPDCQGDHDDWAFHFSSVRSLFYLEPVIKDLIHGFKYHSLKRSGRFLSEHLRYNQGILKYMQQFDFILPVPLHPLRKRERGYNQSEVIAEVLSRISGLPLLIKVLQRKRYTVTQTKMDSEQRKKNLHGAFALNKNEDARGKKYLLVDDVFTTGSTLDTCAEILKSSGAAGVGAITLANVRAAESTNDYRRELEIACSFAL